MSDATADILRERAKMHGVFQNHARITQNMKNYMRGIGGGRPWEELTFPMRESLDMIAHRIGRILNGNPYLEDHWADIAGYARLVADQLAEKQPAGYTAADAELDGIPKAGGAMSEIEKALETIECPYPKSVFPMTIEQYCKAVPDEANRTAISGLLMRLGWKAYRSQLQDYPELSNEEKGYTVADADRDGIPTEDERDD